VRVFEGFSDAAIKYVRSDTFVEDLQIIGSAIANSLFDAIVKSFTEKSLGDVLKGAGGPLGLALGGEVGEAFAGASQQQAEDPFIPTTPDTPFGSADNTSATSDQTAAEDIANIREEFVGALGEMSLSLRGELDVSDNVASLEDVDARLEQQVRSSRESGTGGFGQ